MGVQRGATALLVDGVEGSAKAPSSWGAGESEVSLASGATAIRCHPALTDPEIAPEYDSIHLGRVKGLGKRRTAGGDATGHAQRVPLAKMCGTTTHILRSSLMRDRIH